MQDQFSSDLIHKNLARQILQHEAPEYTFAFLPYLNSTFGFGLSPDRPVCKAYLQGHCPSGLSCPEKHNNNSSNFNNLVCKHWLRGLCKKGDGCEFLHEYNLRKMPECNFFTRYGYCSNGEECLYLHLDPSSKLPPCPHYDKGFCALGPNCSQRHVRKILCEFYLAGFCPDGKACKKSHPRWPDKLPKATPKIEKSAEELEEEQRLLMENAEREQVAEREKYGERAVGRNRWHTNTHTRGGIEGIRTEEDDTTRQSNLILHGATRTYQTCGLQCVIECIPNDKQRLVPDGNLRNKPNSIGTEILVIKDYTP